MAHSYRDSLAYLYSLQLFGIKLGLHNIRELLTRVGNPQGSLRIIHIAGTNGKGSTAAALANIFHLAGLPAGLYTSPHLHSFTERIRIATRQISEPEVVELVDELRPHAEVLRTTFFEFTTAMALLCFQRHGVEWAILETGLGGRLDATNIVSPELCLVTPIALDHTAYLGHCLTDVAIEKAGILKSGAAAVSAQQAPEVEMVLRQRSAQLDIPLRQVGQDYHWFSHGDSFSYEGSVFSLDQVRPALAGVHQQQNLTLAAAAMDCLSENGLNVSPTVIKAGLEQVCWPGRLEWLPRQILLDGAHNPAGAKTLAEYLRHQNLKNIHMVVGCKADKQADELLSQLLPFVACVYATRPSVDNAVPPEVLMQQAQEFGVQADVYADPAAAINAALENRPPGAPILVAGSLFLVADVRGLLMPEADVLKISV